MKATVFILVLLAFVPFFHNGYATNIAIIVMLYAMSAVGLSLLMGYTGQISLGQAGFYGLGAYGSAILTTRLGISPWLGIVCATSAVIVLAYGLGWIIFRLHGHYLAVATLAFGLIVSVAFVELRGLTGGPDGLTDIPSLDFFGIMLSSDRSFYFVAFAACAFTVISAQNLVRSPVGLAIRGVADSEVAVVAAGINVSALKRSIFMLSAFYSSLSGSLYAHYIGYISPQPFDVEFSIYLVTIIAVGGFRSIPGVLFATILLTVMNEPLKQLGYYDVVVYGALLVLIIMYMPEGLLHWILNRLYRVSRAVQSR